MVATQTLPENYRKVGTLDLSKDRKLLIIFNVVAVASMAAAGWLFFRAMFWLRSGEALRSIWTVEISSIGEWAVLAAGIIGLSVFYIIFHEALHGIFFWVFTRSRPRFAFRLTYAYAAAPGWFISRNAYLITALAPLIVISAIGLLIFAAGPVGWLLPVWFMVTMNAAGSVGDIAVAAWLLRQPSNCLAQDCGDAVTLYNPR